MCATRLEVVVFPAEPAIAMTFLPSMSRATISARRIDFDTPPLRLRDLGVVVANGSGVHEQVRIANVRGCVALVNGGAEFFEVRREVGGARIAARDCDATCHEQLADRRHVNATRTNEVDRSLYLGHFRATSITSFAMSRAAFGRSSCAAASRIRARATSSRRSRCASAGSVSRFASSIASAAPCSSSQPALSR